jgi:hypothetical protein
VLQGRVFLVGYEYARPDSSDAVALTELPKTDLEAELYRHPHARGLHRQSFRKRFDLYSLGCVLLELALWERLVDCQSRFVGHDLKTVIAEADNRQQDVQLPTMHDSLVLERSVFGVVAHHAGDSFANAVRVCFAKLPESDGESEASLEVQNTVVDCLKQCII